MPTYDYCCDACGHQFEHFQSITATALRDCPECGKRRLRRLIGTGGGVIFKGAGFYQTDYRSDSYKKAAKADTDAKPAPAEAKPSPADAKPSDGKNATKSTPAKGASKKRETKADGPKAG